MTDGVVTGFGPISTDQDGNLSKPIRMCRWGAYRCKHSSVYDWHYFYCSAQGPDSASALRGVGSGVQLHRGPYPTEGCPWFLDAVPVTPEEDAAFEAMSK